jgi:hypothetical protein
VTEESGAAAHLRRAGRQLNGEEGIAMQLLRDDRHQYRGTWGHPATCRILIYLPTPEDADRRPVIVCEELAENRGTSVTNMAEFIAAEVVARYFPHLLDTDANGIQPVRWLERYPPEPGWAGECDEVTFHPWRIRVVWLGGERRRALGTPQWHAVRQAEARTLALAMARATDRRGGRHAA